jgi:hypothetical protein
MGAASAATITFNEVSGAGNPIITSLMSGGFMFASEHFHTIAAGQGAFSDNGTTFIADDIGGPEDNIVMTAIGGVPFTLNSFDVAELFVRNQPERPNATAVEVIGALMGGGTVTQTFSFDLVTDGPGGVADFQTFFLASTFTNLVSVTFRGLFGLGGGAIGLDNIVVNERAIPLPAAGWLMLAGLGAAGVLGRRKAIAR